MNADCSMSGLTELLNNWEHCDDDSINKWAPFIVNELRKIASNHLNNEKGYGLEVDDLVNDTYLALTKAPSKTWSNRNHFFKFSNSVMKHSLVSKSRWRNASKRGGRQKQVVLDEKVERQVKSNPCSSLSIRDTLSTLKGTNPQMYNIASFILLGLSQKEIAELLELSEKTIGRKVKELRHVFKKDVL